MLYKQIKNISTKEVKKLLAQFFKEDFPDGDITTSILQKINNKMIYADIITREDMIFVGEKIISSAFISEDNSIIMHIKDGEAIKAGSKICTLYANYSELLKKERVVLNLIQHLSGIASFVNQLNNKALKKNIKILDTRKTTPGIRIFEKYAVFKGGGTNHRLNLSEGILIKDNHIALYNSLEELLIKIKSYHKNKPIEVEVENLQQIQTALKFKVDAILIDNMSPNKIKTVLSKIRKDPHGKNIFIEVSGGINHLNIDSYLIEGINAISMGCITHSIKNKDISMKFNI